MRRFLLFLLLAFAIAQFVRPDTTNPTRDPANDLIAVTHPSAEVTALLRAACYDCHSHETRYPWYVSITPVNWWMQHHVDEGREEFNMSEWGARKAKWQRHKAEESVEMVKKREMPLDSYTWGHPEARLTDAQRQALASYFSGLVSALPGGKDDRAGSREHEDH
ncbi:MAG: heme-binding domain-containing protein [Flavobacteriales bacterium]|nr:heme-binding domain-containing protein [Flavobacteriales bacterium]